MVVQRLAATPEETAEISRREESNAKAKGGDKGKGSRKRKAKTAGGEDDVSSTPKKAKGPKPGQKPLGGPSRGPKIKLWKLVDSAPLHGSESEWLTTLYEASGRDLSKLELYPGGDRIQQEDVAWQENSNEGLLAELENCSKALILSTSALRACAVIKTVSKPYRPVAKLFAKHMSVGDQAKFCKSKKPQMAVGTPNRILRLAELGALDDILSDPKAVIVFDINLDVKNFSVVTMPTVSTDAFTFLREAWLKRPRESRPRLGFSTA
mmetsp:Transcript_11274/g.19887  ORF Transcript_11274/g.19887 Transcript_11274/m.19887 type:complete len:266 (+) Transcript_11274:230-1027(+)|eukprot:CAMPEP_0184527016 /NCGR_PEP_ID=MMETSP0198_2-20121128/10971_1 /TAXON_ID=1112570 /ORGANISM="Thraustochytrium sp., Strain LLF1b" /LENGTH=265 /DNA_ID=CAMNT_0026918643 /DNA_START=980 /DNA_END=1777 /DNA_ORIENTATION=+